MPTMVTINTGRVLNAEEGEKLKNKLAKVRGVNRVGVLYPDRVLISYESARVSLSTLKAAVGGREIKNISVNRK